MQAAVAVRLGIGNVVLLLDQRQVVLPHEHVRYRVNILDKRTDHADTANIVQIIYHRLQRDRKSAPLELADNAARTFDAALDGINRAWLARNTRLIAQNIQLGLDLADAGFVQHHHLLHLHRGFDQHFLVVLRQPVNREKVSQFHSLYPPCVSLFFI